MSVALTSGIHKRLAMAPFGGWTEAHNVARSLRY
jgi:hypothetical protein